MSPETPISLKEALELRTLFFSEEGENLHYVPTKSQYYYISDLQRTVQENMRKYL